MIQVLSEVRKKLSKDADNMLSTTVSGSYLTSNRFCESIFGLLKNREEASPKAALESTVMTTVAKMNDLKTFLKKLSKSKKEKLWERINNKALLTEIATARKDLKNNLREQSKSVKDAQKMKKMKTAENKRKREEKKLTVAKKPKKNKILKKLPVS
jgi:hypothetical protein